MATAGTSASVSIDRGTLAKTIYAINGSTSFTLPVHVSPGDTLTYRLQQAFPTSRTDDFRMTDYLPLPVFYAAEVITFDAVADETAPAAGHAKYGPDDDFHTKPGAPTPTVSSDITANSVEFLYGNYALYPPEASTADILFTVTVSTDPFADGLLSHEPGPQPDQERRGHDPDRGRDRPDHARSARGGDHQGDSGLRQSGGRLLARDDGPGHVHDARGAAVGNVPELDRRRHHHRRPHANSDR